MDIIISPSSSTPSIIQFYIRTAHPHLKDISIQFSFLFQSLPNFSYEILQNQLFISNREPYSSGKVDANCYQRNYLNERRLIWIYSSAFEKMTFDYTFIFHWDSIPLGWADRRNCLFLNPHRHFRCQNYVIYHLFALSSHNFLPKSKYGSLEETALHYMQVKRQMFPSAWFQKCFSLCTFKEKSICNRFGLDSVRIHSCHLS